MVEPARIIPAATIMIVRDADQLEVLMIERHRNIAFAGGALVFPGGKVGREDADQAWAALIDGGSGDPAADAPRVAAIREAYEETGLLLARPSARRGAGRPLVRAEEAPALFEATAGELEDGRFLALVADAGLVLALDALTPFASWLTPNMPEVMPRRFDTHFFLAVAPPDQVAVCDGNEAVEACWIVPGQAIRDAEEERRLVLFPTRMNLEMVSRSADAATAVADARARPAIRVETQVVMEDGVKMLKIPAEAGYIGTSERFVMPS